MTLVVDASVVVRWFLDPDGVDLAAGVLPLDENVIAPDLVIPEIANAFWKYVTFDRGSTEKATMVVLEAATLFNEIVPSVELKDRAFAIALELRHPIYDCFYLALAEQRNCQFVTADDRLLGRCAATPFARLVRSLVNAPSARRR